jgi:TRAP-type C4-dicarboxylate transport system substrate-binding protein
MRTIRPYLSAPALLATLVAAGCGGSATVDKAGEKAKPKTVELVLAEHDSSQTTTAWAAAVARRSAGTLRIRVAHGWRGAEADYEKGMVGDVRTGKADLAAITTRAFDEVGVTSFQPLAAPLLIDSTDLERRVLSGDIGARALAGLEPTGLAGLGLLPTELRRPLGITHVLQSPSDYRHLMVYTREGKVARETLEALGAAPVHKGSDVWMDGVDGAEIGLRALSDQGTAASYYSGLTANVVLWPQPVAIVIRRATLQRLSDDQRRALQAAWRDVFDQATRQASASDAAALQDMCAIGVKLVFLSPAQREALQAAVAPVYAEIARAPGNAAALAEIRALKGTTQAAPLGCRSAAVSPGPVSHELDGTYRTRFSEQDAARWVGDPDQVGGEQWGDFTLRLAGGKLRLSQRNTYTSSLRRGTYSIDGDRIRVTFDEFGESNSLRWTLYRGKLRFEMSARAGGPLGMLVKPFERVD